MKIGIASDLHLEFGALDKPIPEVDVLILAGDIFLADDIGGYKNSRVTEFAKEANKAAAWVIFIPGNHEFYHMEYFTAMSLMKEFCAENYWIWLDNERVDINGKNFIGATLWTDGGPNPASFQFKMADYRVIKYEDRKLTPQDTARFHSESLYFLENEMQEGDIVVTHHLPSFRSIDARFKYAGEGVNNAYASHLDGLIEAKKPAMWVHGHSHSPKDYMIGNTRVISNPRGYWGYEDIADNFEVMVV